MDDDPWAQQPAALQIISDSLQPQQPQDPYATILDGSRPLRWNEDLQNAALAFAGITVAPQDTTVPRIARATGIAPQHLKRWRAHPHFATMVDGMTRQAAEFVLQRGIALKANRVMSLAARHGLLMEIIESRQEWYMEEFPDEEVEFESSSNDDRETVRIPGLHTGVIVYRRKRVGEGGFGRDVLEASIDMDLLRELREIEKQMSMETGQWQPSAHGNTATATKLYIGLNIDAV